MADITIGNLGGRIDPDWLEGAQYQTPGVRLSQLGSPAEIAAYRTAQGQRPLMGRPEGPIGNFAEDFLLPKTPLDYAMYAAGGPGSRLAKAAALGIGGLLSSSSEAEAGPAGKLLKLGRGAPKGGGQFPGIFQHPNELAAQAEAMVADEHPALKYLFGVTRDDLSQMGKQGTRQGNILDPQYGGKAANPKGSYIIQVVGTPENEHSSVTASAE